MMEDREQVEEVVVVVAQEPVDITLITEWSLLYRYRHLLQEQQGLTSIVSNIDLMPSRVRSINLLCRICHVILMLYMTVLLK